MKDGAGNEELDEKIAMIAFFIVVIVFIPICVLIEGELVEDYRASEPEPVWTFYYDHVPMLGGLSVCTSMDDDEWTKTCYGSPEVCKMSAAGVDAEDAFHEVGKGLWQEGPPNKPNPKLDN